MELRMVLDIVPTLREDPSGMLIMWGHAQRSALAKRESRARKKNRGSFTEKRAPAKVAGSCTESVGRTT